MNVNEFDTRCRMRPSLNWGTCWSQIIAFLLKYIARVNIHKVLHTYGVEKISPTSSKEMLCIKQNAFEKKFYNNLFIYSQYITIFQLEGNGLIFQYFVQITVQYFELFWYQRDLILSLQNFVSFTAEISSS